MDGYTFICIVLATICATAVALKMLSDEHQIKVQEASNKHLQRQQDIASKWAHEEKKLR